MLNSKLNNWGVVILAAGRGTRLNCTDKPKVMCEIGGKPIVSYIINNLEKIGFTAEQIMLVVGFHKEKIQDYFDGRVSYAEQVEQKGTAHAAYVGAKSLPSQLEHILVINGDDSAFYSAEAVLDFIEQHSESKAVASVLSAELADPISYGRIIKHPDGIVEIIEKEYLSDEQKKIKEISTGTFCFERFWFENMFPSMPPLRKLGEYGLPTALAMASNAALKVQVVKLKDNKEWFGVNTPAELEEADKRKSII